MNDSVARNLTLLVLAGLVIQLFVIGYSYWSGHQGRQALVTSQRSGCERSKLDRVANAKGWRNAEGARRAEGQIDVADEYASIAAGLEARSRISCAVAFPKESLLP